MGMCFKIGVCIAPKKKKRTQVASSHHVNHGRRADHIREPDIPSRFPKKGIGRSIETESGTVAQIEGLIVQGSDQHYEGNVFHHQENLHDRISVTVNNEEIWYDSQIWLDSDSDDDFRSVNGDSLSALSTPFNSTQMPQRPTFETLKDRMQNLATEQNISEQGNVTSPTQKKKLGEFFLHTVMPTGDAKAGNEHVSMNEGDEQLGNSFQRFCLPRLIPSVSFNDKKVPVSPGIQKGKNAAIWLPFRRHSNDNFDEHDPFVSNLAVARPVAGSQIPFSGKESSAEGSWCLLRPSTFKLRGPNYLRDKIKFPASESAMYEPFGVDVFLSHKKVNHIARHVELPAGGKVGKVPMILILNIQVPMYPASIFLNETDGEGLNLIMYYKLSEKHTELPSYFHDLFRKILDDEVEHVRGFAVDSLIPFRERLKILGRVVNPEELHLSVPERKVVYTYNEKPVLSRPQHSFYQGDGYFEIDLDMHRFSYLARKGVESFRERLKLCILDLGLTIQGNRQDELPEQVLCCVRINKIDFTNCKRLAVNIPSRNIHKYNETDASISEAGIE